MIDPLGVDEANVGHWCGLCDVEYHRASSFSRLRQLSRRPLQSTEALWWVAECLGGNRASFRHAMQRYLLRLHLEGKPYGFVPCTMMLRRVLLRGSGSVTDDALDIVLDYVFGVGCGLPDYVRST